MSCRLELYAVHGADAFDISGVFALVDVDALSVNGVDAGLGLGGLGDAFFESDAAAALSSCFAFGFGGPLNPWKDLPGGTVCISRGFHQLEMLQQGQSIIFHSETTHSACPGERDRAQQVSSHTLYSKCTPHTFCSSQATLREGCAPTLIQ